MSSEVPAHIEKKFLNAIAGQVKKRPGRHKKDRMLLDAIEANTATFFSKTVLSDQFEADMWKVYLTGKLPDGSEAKLNPISFNAFKQAVAYKRGMPTVRVDTKENKDIEITFNVIGGNAPSFRRVLPPEHREKISQSMQKHFAENSQVIDSEVVSSEVNQEV